MAQRQQVTWGELRVGIFVLMGLALLGVGVFYVTGSTMFGARYMLVTYLPEVDGLNVGGPVSLDGVQVGNVESISMAMPGPGVVPDPNRSVEIRMRVSEQYKNYIRTDSTASLVTQGFLGERTVTVRRGFTGRVLQDGDELPGTEEKAVRAIMDRGADLLQNLNELSTEVVSIVTDVRRGRGTLGKLLEDETAYNRVNDTLGIVNEMAASIQQGKGTLGQLVASDALYNKVDSSVTRVDDVLAAVQQQKGSLGKFIYDPSFHDSASQFLNSSNALLADVRAGRGTLGKLATDDSLFTMLRETSRNVRDATAKLNSNQTTAGKIFSDPQLYDNISGLTGDLRLLVGEFRKDPKKFLHVSFSIF
jgi:phospholipid/cholesterol/gamma-HCH transport system substrate-binding protein